MIDITASIVLYKTPADQLEAAIDSYFSFDEGISKFLYLIDNAPGGTVIPWDKMANGSFSYIPLEENQGYGKAHNKAIEAAYEQSRYHLILNPDIRFSQGTLKSLLRYMDANPDIIECMPRVIYPSGKVQHLCKLLPNPLDLFGRRFIRPRVLFEKRNNRFELVHSGYDTLMDVPCLSGCFMFFRSRLIAQNKLKFDERFFMYLEDFDLIRRCNRVGRTVYNPNITIIHDHQQMSYKSLKSMINHIISAMKYFNKYGWLFDAERRIINKKTLAQFNINTERMLDSTTKCKGESEPSRTS